ncbi:hypothetical protein HYH03_005188 [Edaphochlamys debaryana]|uniref:KOW domain-containing protein n=1 Tax=Edaphochlamys debaryana TaxID=47281 RepID=A0A836C1I2_9CHLO|nr:hypothetical protein HYH03_005188 [Edaphochlamys debaryana]|eukprot:KAG2496780.1 hypothetical protein HYH03_005188 [Edaphochlamys debaryana]
MFVTNRWRICRDDIVYILSGPDKGKTGKVLEVFKDKRVPQVIVEGRNLRKKKVRTGSDPSDFFVVTMEAPLHYSQVQLLDPTTGKPVRVVYMYTPEGEKVRVRKVAEPTVNDILPTPSAEQADPRAGLVGSKDTTASLARKATYAPAAGFPFRLRDLERIWAGMAPDSDRHGRDLPEDPAASVAGTSGVGAVGGSSAFAAARGLHTQAVAEGERVEEQAAGAAAAAAAGAAALLRPHSFAAAGWLGAAGLGGRLGLGLGAGAAGRRRGPGAWLEAWV